MSVITDNEILESKKNWKKRLFRVVSQLVVLISLVFLIIYLNQNDLLHFKGINNYLYFVFAMGALIAGFFVEAYASMVFLHYNKIKIKYITSLVINGKFIFAKYIPGKVGIIVGKSSYISSLYDIRGSETFQKILVYHIIALFGALIVCSFTLFTFLKSESVFFVSILPISILLVWIVSLKKVQESSIRLFKKFLKLDIGTTVSQKSIVLSSLLVIICWLFWSVGFYFLALSMGFNETSFDIGFLFPLGSVAGILVLIAPGGIGVREGVLAAGLIYFKFSNEEAIALSSMSRLWFLCGEVVMFLIALCIQLCLKNVKLINRKTKRDNC